MEGIIVNSTRCPTALCQRQRTYSSVAHTTCLLWAKKNSAYEQNNTHYFTAHSSTNPIITAFSTIFHIPLEL